jgi:hypothetical protein
MNKKDVKINLNRFFGFKEPHVNLPGTDGHSFEVKFDFSFSPYNNPYFEASIWLKDPTRTCLIEIL